MSQTPQEKKTVRRKQQHQSRNRKEDGKPCKVNSGGEGKREGRHGERRRGIRLFILS
jgi:hypothetical protein